MFKQLIDLTAQKRKYLALQLENELLKFERRLPSNKPSADERDK